MDYASYLVSASDQRFLVAKGEVRDVTELMILTQGPMILGTDEEDGTFSVGYLVTPRPGVPDREWQGVGGGHHGAGGPPPSVPY